MPGPDASSPPALGDPRLDALAAMVLELAAELWVTRAELAALKGDDAAALVEDRAAFVRRLMEPVERL